MHKIFKVEISALQDHFFNIMILSKNEMEEVRQKWEKILMVAKSLGSWPMADHIAKEFKEKHKLMNEVEAFTMKRKHYLFWFQYEEDWNAILMK